MSNTNRNLRDLHITTDGVSFSNSLVTPVNEDFPRTIEELFQRFGHSPPPNTDKQLNDVITAANSALRNTGLSWDSMSHKQKIYITFLILKNQIDLLMRKYPQHWQTVLFDTLNDDSERNPVLQFVRKGGDLLESYKSGDEFHKFRQKHPFWYDNKEGETYSAFADNEKKISPFIRYQRPHSVVCWCVCAANAILYFMQAKTMTLDAVTCYGINLGRFLRHFFTDEDIFRTVFEQGGGQPEDFLELVPSVFDEEDIRNVVDYIAVRGDGLVSTLKYALREYGAVIVKHFKVFPEYAENTDRTTFIGDWEQFKPKGENVAYHAFLITGVHMAEEGVICQVQDTNPKRPFLNIGLDLLVTMGCRFMHINQFVTYNITTGDNCKYCYDGDVSRLSPMSGTAILSLASSTDSQPPGLAPTFSDASIPARRRSKATSTKASQDKEFLQRYNYSLDIPKNADLSKIRVFTS